MNVNLNNFYSGICDQLSNDHGRKFNFSSENLSEFPVETMNLEGVTHKWGSPLYVSEVNALFKAREPLHILSLEIRKRKYVFAASTNFNKMVELEQKLVKLVGELFRSQVWPCEESQIPAKLTCICPHNPLEKSKLMLSSEGRPMYYIINIHFQAELYLPRDYPAYFG